jgi:DNA polymerase-1
MFDDFSIPDFPHTIITDPDKVSEQFIQKVGRQPLLSFDFETTGLHFKKHKAAGIAIANQEHAWYIHDKAMHQLTPWLKDNFVDSNITWAAHNSIFDMHFLKNDFNVLPASLVDTQLAQWMLNEEDSLALKEVSKFKLGITENLPSFRDLQKHAKELRDIKKIDDVSIFDIPVEMLGIYAAFDGRLTFDLWNKLEGELEAEGLREVYDENIIPFTYVLLDMEDRGAYIDRDRVIELKDQYEEIADDLLTKWKKKVGDVNPNSPQQLRELLYTQMNLRTSRKTKKTKLPSTDSLALLRLKRNDKTGIVSLLIEYKEYNKLISTYLTPLLNKTIDNYIYTNFKQTGTVTGRLSSSGDINLQNIPSRTEIGKEIRSCFIAPPGRSLLVTDYSQIELRILAHYTRDENLVRVFYWGEDPHQLTANKMGVPRYVGKTLNFGIIYGAQARTIADQIEKIPKPRPKESVARKWLLDFEKIIYPSIPKWKKTVINTAIQQGYITTIGDRHRHVTNLDHYDEYTRGRAERQTINSLIQGSAGDFINQSMLSSSNTAKELDIWYHIQVHDELVTTCPTELLDEASRFMQTSMESMREVFNLSVPILAQPATGANWMECK